MENLGGDEALVLVAAAAVAAVSTGRHLVNLLRVATRLRNRAARVSLAVLPLAAIAVLHLALTHVAAAEVRTAPIYQTLFEVVGVAWLAGAWALMPLTGLSPRDDVLETENPSAAIAVGGAWLGSFACYFAANIGEGPTIWTTLGPAALATALWFAIAVLHELASGAAEAVAIDRDLASGCRLGGLLAALGIVLGAGAAGDWVSAADTLGSAEHAAIVAAILAAASALVHRLSRPAPACARRSVAAAGVVPGTLYVASAITWAALGQCR